MAYRSASSRKGPSSANDIDGSLLSSKRPPPIPSHLPLNVKRAAKVLLESNPHLWSDAQMPSVLRLARFRARFDELQALIDEEGLVIKSAKGELREHPAAIAARSTATAAAQLERALAISFVSRGASVKDAELQVPPRPKTKNSDKRTPTLRLA